MLSTKQFLTLLIAVIMFGSMFFLLPNQNQLPSNEPIIKNQDNATTINYGASGIEAKVLQVFPSMLVLGKTKEAEVSDIDSKIMSSGLVLSISNSTFIGDNYRALLRLKPEVDSQKLKDFFSENGILLQPEFYLQAIIELNGVVQLKNEETGITLDYEFPKNQVNGLVLVDTLKGDKIRVDLVAVFSGKNLSEALAQETSNIETSRQLVFAEDNYEIARLSDEYSFMALSPFEKAKKLYDLLSAFWQTFGKEKVIAEVSPTNSQFTITLTSPYLAGDINRLLSSFQEIQDFTIDENTNKITFFAYPDTNFFSLSEKVELEFDSLGYKHGGLKGPNMSLNGEIFSISENELNSVYGIAKNQDINIEVFRKAFVDANYIFSKDQNFSYKVPQGYFQARVSPNTKIGQDVRLSVFMIASRRQGVFEIQAQEVKTNSLN